MNFSLTEKRRKSGFTLMEMLIVVAVIAILAAIGIPALVSNLEKAREATDLSNIRNAYSEIMTEALLENALEASVTVDLVQEQYDWQTAGAEDSLNGIATVVGKPGKDGTAVLSWENEALTITFDGVGGSEQSSATEPTKPPATHRSFMESAAAGISKSFSELIPSYKTGQARSCLHSDSYTANNGDVVNVLELSITKQNLSNGAYWDPTKVSWGELLEKAGVDLSSLDNMTVNGYIYFDSDINPISVSYYDDNNNYCYTYLDDGETFTLSRMPGERQHAGYYREYARGLH